MVAVVSLQLNLDTTNGQKFVHYNEVSLYRGSLVLWPLGFSEIVEVAGTSYQMLTVLLFYDRERA